MKLLRMHRFDALSIDQCCELANSWSILRCFVGIILGKKMHSLCNRHDDCSKYVCMCMHAYVDVHVCIAGSRTVFECIVVVLWPCVHHTLRATVCTKVASVDADISSPPGGRLMSVTTCLFETTKAAVFACLLLWNRLCLP